MIANMIFIIGLIVGGIPVIYNKVNASYSTKKNLSYYNNFKLGGFSSLRGFQEEQFSGYFTTWSNLELRYLFGVQNNLFIFSDAGYLESMNSDVVTKQGHLYSAGLGLRIATKVGNLTFEYGVGYNQGWSSLYDGLIHFGVETSF
jgi:outer membrane protein insertion porin family